MLIDAGHIERRGGRWTARASIGELVVPPTLQGLIAARLDQAPAGVKRLLQQASVVGKVFWTDALAGLDGADDPAELLIEAARRELVVELDERGLGGGVAFQFRHILIRDVAYDSIPKEERARLHDAFGRWLERAAGERVEEYADIVAYHADQAFNLADELGEPAAADLGRRALTLLTTRGRRAWHAKDLRAVRSFYSRAAHAASRTGASGPERHESELFAAVARAWEETTPEAIDAFRGAVAAARAAGPTVPLAEALWSLAYLVVTSTEDEAEARELYDEAVRVAHSTGDHDVIAATLKARGDMYWWDGDMEGHRAQHEQALAYAREHGVEREIPDVLAELTGNAAVQLQLSRATDLAEEQARLAEASGSLYDRWRASMLQGTRALHAGRPDEAARLAREAIDRSHPSGLRELVGRAYEHLGHALLDAGDPAGARDALLEALRWYDPRSMRGALPEAEWKLSRAYLELGDTAAAEQHAESGRASVLPGDVFSIASTTGALAVVRSAQGREVEAERLFLEALETIGRTDYKVLIVELRCWYADHLMKFGRSREARELLESTLPLAADPLAVRARGQVERRLERIQARA